MKIIFVCSGNSSFGINPIIREQGKSIVAKNVSLEYFPVEGKGAISYLKYTYKLRKRIIKSEYDIIHAHYGFCGIISWLAKGNEKLVVSFMGDDLVGSRNKDGKITLWSRLLSLLNIFLARYFYTFCIVKSEEMEAKLKSGTPSALIPNGVDLSRFLPMAKSKARSTLGFKQNSKLIIFVSDPSRTEKNFNLALSACKLLEISDLDLMVVDKVQTDDIPLYYSAADALLLTSYHEGSPNVIKEAMACNCPIVTTDVGDVKWIIDETPGCFICSHSPDDVASNLMKVLHYVGEKDRTTGRARIIDLGLNIENSASKIMTVYESI